MINANCLVMTPELKELNNQFPKLPPQIFRVFVSKWQYEYNQEGKVPTKNELIRLITKVSDNWANYLNPDEVRLLIYMLMQVRILYLVTLLRDLSSLNLLLLVILIQ